jgi:uncharacterized protein (TIGR02217 family)
MSDPIFFPTFYGRPGFPIGKTSNWSTRMQRAPNGRELRAADYVNPIWNFTLIFPFLYDYADCRFVGSGATEFRTILNFFNGCQGSFASFLFDDPTDDSVVGQPLPPVPNDPTGTLFQLVRQWAPGGFAEWITAPNAITQVTINGTPTGAYTHNTDNGIVTFPSPPGGIVAADFTYYFRVVFTDALDTQQFMHNLWELKQVKLTSIVLGAPIP